LQLEERLAAMPKAEIHVHLEGSARAETSFDIARRNGVALPVSSLEEWRQYFAFRDFAHFIDVYRATVDAIRTIDDLALLVEQFYADQARQNIRYTECFVSMSLHLRRLRPNEILEALELGSARGTERSGVRVAFIADISREEPDSQSRVLALALEGRRRGLIVGIGLGGLEKEFPAPLFRDTYARAAAGGLRVVAHAGEADGFESIRESVEELGVSRIGHGVRVVESPEGMIEMRERGIVFEVCPVSNYALGIVQPHEPHPIRRMLDAGLRCTLNSDDPSMLSTNLAAQYALLAAQGFDWSELLALSRQTLDATFLAADEKAAYHREWDRFAAR
jgi:adenosine deaminase